MMLGALVVILLCQPAANAAEEAAPQGAPTPEATPAEVVAPAALPPPAAPQGGSLCLMEEGNATARAQGHAACVQSVMHFAEEHLAASKPQRTRAKHWAKASAFHQKWAQTQCELSARALDDGTPASVEVARLGCLARLYAERTTFAQRLASNDLRRVQRMIAAPESDCSLKAEQLKQFAAGLPTLSVQAARRQKRDATNVIAQADALARLQCKALAWKGRCRAELEHYYISLVVVPGAAPTVADPAGESARHRKEIHSAMLP
jgi:hypothetical protein